MYDPLVCIVLDNDNDNHISNQRNTEQESDDDEVIEEIMQDGLRHAKMARERLEREEFLQVRMYYTSIILF